LFGREGGAGTAGIAVAERDPGSAAGERDLRLAQPMVAKRVDGDP